MLFAYSKIRLPNTCQTICGTILFFHWVFDRWTSYIEHTSFHSPNACSRKRIQALQTHEYVQYFYWPQCNLADARSIRDIFVTKATNCLVGLIQPKCCRVHRRNFEISHFVFLGFCHFFTGSSMFEQKQLLSSEQCTFSIIFRIRLSVDVYPKCIAWRTSLSTYNISKYKSLKKIMKARQYIGRA